jgi:hypothetical protein
MRPFGVKIEIIPATFADRMLLHYRCFGHFEAVNTLPKLLKMAVLLPFYYFAKPIYAGKFRFPPVWVVGLGVIAAYVLR